MASLFSRRSKSNSDHADEIHASVQSTTSATRQQEQEEEPESDTDDVTWTPMKKYPMFLIDADSDGDGNTAKCSICKGEFDYDDWTESDLFYMNLELHEIKHYMQRLSRTSAPATS